MPLPVERRSLAKIGDKIEASRTTSRSSAGTAIRSEIIPLIALNLPKQKNSCSLDNLHASLKASTGPLQRVPCIRYPVQFQKDQPKVKALIDSGSEVNAMTPAFAAKLGLRPRPTNVVAQKIYGLPLKTYGMASARFSIQDSLGKV